MLALAGKVGNVPGAEVTTNLAKGTITLRSETAQTYFLDYQAAYGSAETDTGKIRVDVRAPESPPLDPVAVPDTVTLFGQAASLVDVLANDVDPSGGLLSVQRADAPAGSDVIRQGEQGDRFYIVDAGRLATLIDGTAVNELGPGDSFGEIALLHSTARTATVTALEDSRLVELASEPFLTAVASSGDSAAAAAAVVTARLASA